MGKNGKISAIRPEFRWFGSSRIRYQGQIRKSADNEKKEPYPPEISEKNAIFEEFSMKARKIWKNDGGTFLDIDETNLMALVRGL